MMKTIKTLLVVSIYFWLTVGFAANHQPGLHLQLPNVTIDIKRADVEDIQVFHTTPENALALIRLRPKMTEQLYQQTSKALGQQALWIWNGRVVGIMKLEEPINEYLTVPNLTGFEADDLNAAVSR